MSCLHDYETIFEDAGGLSEFCRRCGQHNIVRKDPKGRPSDMNHYRREHALELLQPDDPRFEREYGNRNRKREEESLKKRNKEIEEDLEWEEKEKIRKWKDQKVY